MLLLRYNTGVFWCMCEVCWVFSFSKGSAADLNTWGSRKEGFLIKVDHGLAYGDEGISVL